MASSKELSPGGAVEVAAGEREPLVRVVDLAVVFKQGRSEVRAVDGVSFEIQPGESLALVGESGSGKSATALALARLHAEPPARYPRGSIRIDGLEILTATDRELRRVRGGVVGYVFQEPSVALNPVMTVGAQLDEALKAHGTGGGAGDERERLLHDVGLHDTRRVLRSYPHELSGGMQQRVVIAMALAGRPRLLVADEPTTALDVTVQARILDLLCQIQRSYQMSLLFITHNLGIVARIAGRVLVMYGGKIIEEGPTTAILQQPRHPYTQALLRAVPRLRGPRERLEGIPGAVPSGLSWPSGCRFHPRCPFAETRCREEEPPLDEGVRCHFWRRILVA